MKYLFTSAKALLLIPFTLWFTSLSAQTNITTTIGSYNSSTCAVGDTIVLPVSVNMASGISISAIALTIDFDNTKLLCIPTAPNSGVYATQVHSMVAAGFLSNVTFFPNQNPNPPYSASTRNQFRAVWFNLVPVAFNGIMFNLRFVVLSTGSSTVKWDLATPGNCEYADELADIIPNCNFTDGNIACGTAATGPCAPLNSAITPSGPTSFCQGGSVVLGAYSSTGLTYQWRNNGTDIPGATNATYVASNSGLYSVLITDGSTCSSLLAPVPVTAIFNSINNNLFPTDTLLHCGDSLVLDAGTGYTRYEWSSGDTTQTKTVRSTGWHRVRVYNGLCSVEDSVFVSINDIKALARDSVICTGSPTLISINEGRQSLVNNNTNFSVRLTVNMSQYLDPIAPNGMRIGGNLGNVGGSINGIPMTTWNPMSPECALQPLSNSLWTTEVVFPVSALGSTVQFKFVNGNWGRNEGSQILSGCGLPDGFGGFNRAITLQRGMDLVYCYESCLDCDGSIAQQNVPSGIVWSTGDTTSTITVSPTQTTTYYATVSNGIHSCVDSVTVTVIPNPLNPNIFAADTLFHCGDSLVLDAGIGYSRYEWSSGDTTQSKTVRYTGWHRVRVYNGFCSVEDSVFVSILQNNFLESDTVICQGSSLTINTNIHFQGQNLNTTIGGYWPLRSNTLDYSSFNNHAVQNNFSSTIFADGLYFDGIDDHLSISAEKNQNCSFSFWFKTNNSTGDRMFFNAGPNGNGPDLFLSCGQLNWNVWDGCNNPLSAIPNNYADNQYHHIILTNHIIDGSKLFFDGILIGSASYRNAGLTNLLYLAGAGNYGDYCWNGYMSDFILFKKALSPSEVQFIHNRGRVLVTNLSFLWSTGDTTAAITVSPTQTTTYYVTVSNGIHSCVDSVTVNVIPNPLNPNIFAADTLFHCGDSLVLDAGTGYTRYEWSSGDTTQSKTVRYTGWHRVRAYDGLCSVEDSVFVSIISQLIEQSDTMICSGSSIELNLQASGINGSLRNGLVGYWPFNGNADDESGNSHQTSLNNTSFGNDRFGALYQSLSVGDKHGLMQTPLFPQNEITFSFWYFFNGTGGNWNTLAGRNGGGYHHLLIEPSSYQIGFFNNGFYTSGYGLNIGNWYNIICTKSGNQHRLWLNGVMIQDVNSSFANSQFPLSVLGNAGIGWGQGSLGYFDDFIIWNRALTPSEIQRLYNPFYGASVSWSTGDTTSSITVSPTQTTTYYVTVSNGIHSCVDSVTVTVIPNPLNPNIFAADTLFHCGDSLVLDAGIGYSRYEWSSGDTTQTKAVRYTGWHRVRVYDGSCSVEDSVFVSLISAAIGNNDTTICSGSSLKINMRSTYYSKSTEFVANQYYDYDDFEGGPGSSDDWSERNGVDPQIVSNTSFKGNNSLYFNNGWGRNFELQTEIGQPYGGYFTADYPFISMAYKIPPGSFTSMLVHIVGHGWRGIAFTQGEQLGCYGPKVGSWNENDTLVRNNQWHFKTINLHDQLQQSLGSGNYKIESIIFHDACTTIPTQGEMWIDDFMITRLDPITSYSSVSWSNGDTTASITVSPTQTTTYYATFSNGIHSCLDSVTVNVIPNPLNPNLFAVDSLFHCGDSLLLDAGSGYSRYQWSSEQSSGDSTQTKLVRYTGWYKVRVFDGVCSVEDSVFVSIIDFQAETRDTVICSGSSTLLNVQGIRIPLMNTATSFSVRLTVNMSQFLGPIASNGMRIGGNFGDVGGTINGIPMSLWSPTSPECAMQPIGDSLWTTEVVFPTSALGSAVLFKFVNGNWGNNEGTAVTSISTNGCGYNDGGGNFNRRITLQRGMDLIYCYDSCANCDGSSAQQNEPAAVSWSTGDTTSSITVSPTQTTTYYVTVSNGIHSCVDSVTVNVIPNPLNPNIFAADTLFHCGDSLVLDAGIGYSRYEWSSGDTTHTKIVRYTGWHRVRVYDGLCSVEDSVFVSIISQLIEQSDTMICSGSSIELNLQASGINGSLRNGLVGYWPFNGNADDVSGNGNHGAVNGATLTTDRFGNQNSAYDFDGLDDFINVQDTPSLFLVNSDFTFSAWILSNSTWSNHILYKGQSSGDNYPKYIFSLNQNYPSFHINGPGLGTGIWEHSNSMVLNNLEFLTLTLSNGQIQFYKNAQLVGSYPWSHNIPMTNGQHLRIGGSEPNGGGWWNGKLDDIGIWNRALTPSEIQTLYNSSYGASVSWSTGDTTSSITVSPTQTTTYYVTVSNGIHSCVDSVTVRVTPKVFVPDMAVCQGDTINVPIIASSLDSVAAISLALNYNQQAMTYVGYTGLRPDMVSTTSIGTAPGQVRLGWFGLSPLISTGPDTLVYYRFVVNQPGGFNWNTQVQGDCELADLNLNILDYCFEAGNFDLIDTVNILSSSQGPFEVEVGASIPLSVQSTGASRLQWQRWNPQQGVWTNLQNNADYAGAESGTLTYTCNTYQRPFPLFRLQLSNGCRNWYGPAMQLSLKQRITISVGQFTACQGDTVEVPLTVTGARELGAVSLTLGFNPGAVQFVDWINAAASTQSNIWLSNQVGNEIRLAWFSLISANIPDGNALGTLRIVVTNSTPLTWDLVTPGNCEFGDEDAETIPAQFVSGNLTVNSLPTVNLGISSPFICPNAGSATLSTISDPNYTYAWYFNGQILPNSSDHSITTNLAGTYQVLVTNSSGCMRWSSLQTLGHYPLPNPVITATGSTTTCNQPVSLSVNSTQGGVVEYRWFLNGTLLSTTPSNQWVATVSGSYSVQAIDIGTGCSAWSSAMAVAINPLPNPVITATGSTTTCNQPVSLSVNSTQGGVVEYRWYQNGTLLSITPSNQWVATVSGSYSVQAIDIGTGCSAWSSAMAVAINPLPNPVITATGSTTTCNQPVSLSVNSTQGGAVEYRWFLNGTLLSTTPSNQWVATVSGSYSVQAIDIGTGCSAWSSAMAVAINPLPNPVITFNGSSTFCLGDSLLLNIPNLSGHLYQWNSGSLPIPGATSASLMVRQGGQYTVQVTNEFACQNLSSPVTITTQNCNALSGVLSYNNTANTVLRNSKVYLALQNGSLVDSSATNNSGQYSIAGYSNNLYQIRATSSINWGGVNATDALGTVRHYTNVVPITGLRLKAADVNGSNSVNNTDALLITRRYSNLLSGFNVGNWASENISIQAAGTPLTQNLKAICYGDINGSYNPSLVRLAPKITVLSSGLVYTEKHVVRWPLYAADNQVLGAVSLAMGIPQGLELVAVQSYMPNGHMEFGLNADELRIGWFSQEGVQTSVGQHLFDLVLRISDEQRSEWTPQEWEMRGLSELADYWATPYEFGRLSMPSISRIRESLVTSKDLLAIPNPSSGDTKLQWTLSAPVEHAYVRVVDALGRVVMEENLGTLEAGSHTMDLPSAGWALGSYGAQLLYTSQDGRSNRLGTILKRIR